MLTKKLLLEYIDDLEKSQFELEERIDALSCRVKKLETKPKGCPCVEKDAPKVKRGPGRPKGNKSKTKK